MVNSEIAKTHCPECDALVAMRAPRIGLATRCRKCYTDLEVVSIHPFEVDSPYQALGQGEWPQLRRRRVESRHRTRCLSVRGG